MSAAALAAVNQEMTLTSADRQPKSPRRRGSRRRARWVEDAEFVDSAIAAAVVASQGQGGAVWEVVTGRYAGIVAASVSARGKDIRVAR